MASILLLLCLIGWSSASAIRDEEEFKEEMFMNNIDPVNKTLFEINEEAGLNLYQGDILLPTSGEVAILGDNYRWPNKIVPYEINTTEFTSTEIEFINQQLIFLNKLTSGCLKIREKQDTDVNWIYIRKLDGCYSYLGRVGSTLDAPPGAQVLSYGQGCLSSGTVHHEYLHAIGMFHEQSRPDRDSFVTIVTANIKPDFEHNFDKYTTSQVTTLGTPYDYLSCMHYSDRGFSINGEPTIVATETKYQEIMGRVKKCSLYDIERVYRLYNCPPFQV